MKKNTKAYVAAFALLAGGLGWLVFSGLTENSVYFLNVSEALAAKAENPAKLTQVRLFGTVAEGDIVPAKGAGGVAFNLIDQTDPGKSIRVDYKGAVPDTFKPGAEVIVEGGVKSGNVFSASVLMTKCPSKYEKENRKG